jgi:hypothetical protein
MEKKKIRLGIEETNEMRWESEEWKFWRMKSAAE